MVGRERPLVFPLLPVTIAGVSPFHAICVLGSSSSVLQPDPSPVLCKYHLYHHPLAALNADPAFELQTVCFLSNLYNAKL